MYVQCAVVVFFFGGRERECKSLKGWAGEIYYTCMCGEEGNRLGTEWKKVHKFAFCRSWWLRGCLIRPLQVESGFQIVAGSLIYLFLGFE